MTAYIIRRLLATIPVMVVVAIFVFLLLHLTPGDPAAVIAGDDATPEAVDGIRTKLGLDQPIHVQFGIYAANLLRGDLGTSIFSNLPVLTLVKQRLEPTLVLAASTLVMAVLLAIPMGVLAAWKARERRGERRVPALESAMDEVLDAQSGLAATLTADDCQFQYRDSLFKRHPGRFVVTRLTLKLSPRFEPVLAYQDLQNLPAQSIASPQAVRRAIQSLRARKLPDYRIFGNVGSFFKNPSLSKTVIETLEQAQVIQRNAGNAQGKVSAAALIQAAGLGDLSVGQAGISPRHHLVLENRGGATLTDILTLASFIQDRVKTRFGIGLEIEPQQLTQLVHAPNPKG